MLFVQFPYDRTTAPGGDKFQSANREGNKGVPTGRLGEVDEIADVITFLTSHAARFITGQIIAVNAARQPFDRRIKVYVDGA